MKLKYYYDLLTGKTDALNPAKLDLPHMWAVFQSWIRSLFPTPKHIEEQIIWRRLQIIQKSPKCWEQGTCIQCGCDMIGKTKADMACENEPFCYPEMMKRRAWKTYKKENNIKLFE